MSRTKTVRTPASVVVAALLFAFTAVLGGMVATLAPAPAGAAYGSSTASFGTLSCTGWVGATTPTGTIAADFTITGGGGRGGGEAPEDDNKGNPGGAGGRVIGRIAMNAGDNMYAWQGCAGSSTTGAQGYSDGGDGSGAGGGASALCVGSSTSTCTVIAIAGGGGGGGRASDNGAGACSSGNDGGDGGAANAGTQASGQNGGTGDGGGAGQTGSGGEPGRGGGGGGGTGVAGEGGSAAGNNTGGLGGKVPSNNQSALGGNGGSSGVPSRTGGTGHGGDRSSTNSIDGGGGGGGYTGGGGGAGGARRGGTICFTTFSGSGGGGGGSSWAISDVTNRSMDSSGGAAGGQGNGAGGSGAISVTFTTNPAPTGAAVNAGNATKGVAKSITLPASDGETGFTCSIVGSPSKGGVTLGGASSCTASYTASANTNGADSFTYKVTDADGRSSATYTVSLTIVNRAPTGAAQTVSATKGVPLPITLAATDLDGDTVTCTISTPASQGAVTASGCAATYTVGPDAHGDATFSYTVTDTAGAANTATITVEIQNRPPTATAIELSVAAGTATIVGLGGSDPDGDTTTCAATTPTSGSLSSGVGCSPTYTAPGTPGTSTFTYTRADGAGATSTPATVTITVTPAAVHGQVTADDTGAGIPGIIVRLYEDGVGFTPHVATTDASGRYDLGSAMAAGDYRVVFRDPAQGYVDEWHDDSLLRSTSTPVSFTTEQDMTLDASLATGSQIDVTISNPGLFTVALYNAAPAGASAYRSVPNVEGSTSLRGLPAGTYYVSVTDPLGALVTEWSGNQTDRAAAEGIALTAGDDEAAAFTLVTRNTISGTVIDSEGEVPFVTVQAYGTSSGAFVRSTKTDAEGEYALRGLAAGSYKLVFRDATGAHPATWFGGAEVIGSAAAVTMTHGGAVTVDEELPRAATVTGTVTGGPEGTTPISGAKVTLYRNGVAVKTYLTDGAGSYTATGLAPGDYTALFAAPGHRSEYNLDRTRKGDADVVVVESGAEVGLAATLTPV
jgi:hypothetical protein